MLQYLLFLPFLLSSSEVIILTNDISIQWGIGTDSINFTVTVSNSIGWVGIGWKEINTDPSMAGADMFYIENGKVTDLYGTSRESQPAEDSQQDCKIVAQTTSSDGYQVYTVNKLTPSKDKQDNDILDGEYYLLYAWGSGGYGDHYGNRGTIKVSFYKQADYLPQQSGETSTPDNSGEDTTTGGKNETPADSEDTTTEDDQTSEEEEIYTLDGSSEDKSKEESSNNNDSSYLLLFLSYLLALLA